MHARKIITGKNINIHQLNPYFHVVSEMILSHFDTDEMSNSVFILGDYIFHPADYFKQLYPNCRIITYQMEQMCGSATWHDTERVINNLRGADEIWDIDPLNVAYLKEYGINVTRVEPMRYTESLRRIVLAEKPTIDVLMYGFMNERRHRILKRIQQESYGQLKIMWLMGVIDEELDRYIADTKIVLNLHAFEPWHRQEQTRIFYPVINGRCIISETSQLNHFGEAILEAPEEYLTPTILQCIQNEHWKTVGVNGAELFKQLRT